MLGIILVNYKNASDTIECLESVLSSNNDVQVVVVDNRSGDGSMERLIDWAKGHVPYTPVPGLNQSSKPIEKPIMVSILNNHESDRISPTPGTVSFIASDYNSGFAGGNNIGIRHLLLNPDINVLWLLNNDTVVDTEAAKLIRNRMENDPTIGMCGTTVRHYHRPDIIQAIGGHRFDWFTGRSRGVGFGTTTQQLGESDLLDQRVDFITGCSLAVSRDFLTEIGLMNEAYFLYFEEMDWAVRNADRFKIAVEPKAIIFHKEGGSIGSSSERGNRSEMSEYYLMRSKLLFIRTHRPILLISHYVIAIFQVVSRLTRRQPKKARAMLRAIRGLSFN